MLCRLCAHDLEHLATLLLGQRVQAHLLERVVEDVAVGALGVSVLLAAMGHGHHAKDPTYRGDGRRVTGRGPLSNFYLSSGAEPAGEIGDVRCALDDEAARRPLARFAGHMSRLDADLLVGKP